MEITKRKKGIILLTAMILLALTLTGSAAELSACSPTYTESWDGRGSDSENCNLVDGDLRPEEGWIHWVFSTKGYSTQAELVLGGTGSGTYEPGPPPEAETYHFYTPYFEIDGLTATIYLYGGSPGPGGGLVISDFCPGGYEQLEVSKTVSTSYLRTHHWSINKSVSTENGYTLNGTPKIWLDGPGDEGDETATWTVSVLYNGFTDNGFTVEGTITILNTGTLPAVITSVQDVLAGTEICVVCQEDLPYTLLPNETLSCLYLTFVSEKVEGFNEVTVVTERDEYTANKEIIWGDPAQELYSTITVEDSCDIFGTRVLGTVTEPNNTFFLYSKHFAWEDYGRDACSQGFTYQNTATIVETQQSASATLKVNVRCEELTVNKTANTSYTREHFWDIDKSIDTENGYELCGVPKIWLYTDGRGDETATWTVNVTYEGHEDSNYNVSGTITIENTGDLPATITSIEDVLGGEQICIDCSVQFPYVLDVGQTLVCTYDEDGYFEGINEVMVTTQRDEYSADAEIIWGAPTTEINKTVVIIDDSDLLGERELGEATAPEGVTFTYSESFAWADYGRDLCGSYQYDNTASIVGTDKSASATLKVNVQCEFFKGETAWAANEDKPLELRYTSRGNWATYVEYVPGKTSTLFAGQTINVGTVHFSEVVNGKVIITVTLINGWEFEDVRENLKVQDYAKAPRGNPAPGRFAHKKTCDPTNISCSITVPANNFYGVHVNVGRWVPDPNFGP